MLLQNNWVWNNMIPSNGKIMVYSFINIKNGLTTTMSINHSGYDSEPENNLNLRPLAADRISISRIKEAANIIDPVFLNTPQYLCESLSKILQTRIFLKIETQNPIRSFKGRGTELLISKLKNEPEIICASAGNFGQAMAYSCRKKGIKLTVFASTIANSLKIERMRSIGAKVVLNGKDLSLIHI